MSKTLIRFLVGAIIGFYGVALFGANAYAAIVIAVICGVVVDQLFRRGEEL
tara:strand:+ start:334 stop:486 length:153 start_codon:yes stop_codon:yes gene_type:complete